VQNLTARLTRLPAALTRTALPMPVSRPRIVVGLPLRVVMPRAAIQRTGLATIRPVNLSPVPVVADATVASNVSAAVGTMTVVPVANTSVVASTSSPNDLTITEVGLPVIKVPRPISFATETPMTNATNVAVAPPVQCIVCLQNLPAPYVLVPCGHAQFCIDCLGALGLTDSRCSEAMPILSYRQDGQSGIFVKDK